MTGRELIVYILTNGLEDELVFKDGTFLGFMTQVEAAIKFDVGYATVATWIANKQLDAVMFGGTYYIPADAKPSIA